MTSYEKNELRHLVDELSLAFRRRKSSLEVAYTLDRIEAENHTIRAGLLGDIIKILDDFVKCLENKNHQDDTTSKKEEDMEGNLTGEI